MIWQTLLPLEEQRAAGLLSALLRRLIGGRSAPVSGRIILGRQLDINDLVRSLSNISLRLMNPLC
jgi:hypothetical protein